MEERVALVRGLIGQRIGIPKPEETLGFAASVSHALDLVSRAIPLDGGEVLLVEDDFPSLPLAFAGRAHGRLALNLVEGGRGCEQRVVDGIGEATRIVCLSHVNYRTGLRIDVSTIAERCRASRAILVVDASHSAGVIRIPVEHCDVVVFCAHKFLYGLHGLGLIYWNEERLGKMPLVSPGWNSIQSYTAEAGRISWDRRPNVSAIEAGNPNFESLYALGAAIEFVNQWPLEVFEAHALKLADSMKVTLSLQGIELLTPLQTLQAGSSVSIPCSNPERAVEILAANGILAAGSERRLRLSFHAHNHLGDVQRVADAIASAL